jgi:hypothetical protein
MASQSLSSENDSGFKGAFRRGSMSTLCIIGAEAI